MKFILILIGFNFMFGQDFQVGQVWKYKTRTNEISSTLTILKIDNFDETIIHISVNNLKIKSGNDFQNILQHSPISVKALKKSVIKVIENIETTEDFQEGYKLWKSAFDSGEAGVCSITVSEIVTFIESSLNK